MKPLMFFDHLSSPFRANTKFLAYLFKRQTAAMEFVGNQEPIIALERYLSLSTTFTRNIHLYDLSIEGIILSFFEAIGKLVLSEKAI